MKANVHCGTLVLLCLVACNRPDSDLFGADGSPLPASGVGGSSGTTPVAGSGAIDSGTAATTGADMTTSGGNTTTEPVANAGTGATGGNAPLDQGGSGGSSNPPDQGGTAGVPDGVGGSPDPDPPQPVCGNGTLEAGEECDDAGHAGQDGCDASCKVVCSQHGAGVLASEDHHCYAGYDTFPFAAAQQDCVKRGAHLVTISSEAENELALALTHNSKWIGGSEDVSLATPGTGDYQWLTGEPFTYTNWGPQEPNQLDERCNAGGGRCYEHCISIMGDGTWVDSRCDLTDGYVCEWEPAGSELAK